MLQCTMYQETMKVKVSGADDEFTKDLARLTSTVRKSDRTYDKHLKVWIIKNPELYLCIPEVRAAIEDRRRQPMMF